MVLWWSIFVTPFAASTVEWVILSSRRRDQLRHLTVILAMAFPTMAAMLGGLPLALGTGVGSELRRPLGVAIIGGLLFSQLLTLYTTPVVYLYLDRVRMGRWAGLSSWFAGGVAGRWEEWKHALGGPRTLSR